MFDGELTTSADVVVTVNPALPVNQPPVVNIAPVDPVTLPASANLVGSATDDGLPTANLVTTWSVVASPAGSTVAFGDATAAQTSATFDLAGSYTLRLSVFDGELTTSADVVVTVNDPPSNTSDIVYVSSSSNGKVGGISFADEDILAYDPNTDQWSLVFDGSDVGLGGTGMDVNAFAMLANGHILMSTDRPVILGGLGKIDDSDIIEFAPDSLGSTTTGSFTLYLRGADIGLTTNGEDIDAIDFAPDGQLLISTLGGVKVAGVSGTDEDLLAFDRSTGTWSGYFDGSDVGLTNSSEDIWGLSVGNDGLLYLSTLGNFSVAGVKGTGADIFTCMPISLGTKTDCTFATYWQGAAHGFGRESIDGVHIGGALSVVNAAGAFMTATGPASSEVAPDQALDMEDDPLNGDTEDGEAAPEEEFAPPIYLPLISG